MSIDDVLAEALQVKLKTDELILLGDKLYVCMTCGQVSDYYKHGGVCGDCEAKSELVQ